MKLCCLFNYNPLYRFPIYKAISVGFDSDFYFGDTVFEPLKQFDEKLLNGFKKYMKAKKIMGGKYIWFEGVSSVFKREYTHYIVTGSPSYIANWMIIVYAKLFGKKVYTWGHGPTSKIITKKSRFLTRLFYKGLTGIFLYNNHSRQFLEEVGIDSDKIHIIYNSLDSDLQTKYYNSQPQSDIYRKHFCNNYPTVIYIGRIQKRKKLDQLVNAVHKLKGKGCILNLVIVGASTDDDTISKLVDSLGINNQVWFYGPSFNEETNAELLYNADVCVSPGNVGLTCIHSLSYGTPVITNDNFETQMPEYEAIIDGVTGSFFKENDIEDLMAKIQEWVSLPIERRDSIRCVARETIEKNWSVAAQMKTLKASLF